LRFGILDAETLRLNLDRCCHLESCLRRASTILTLTGLLTITVVCLREEVCLTLLYKQVSSYVCPVVYQIYTTAC
jgi:hypothetical protein